ncbi:MAG TPA: hypothetical protein VFT32_01550 [Candidatus Eisenbacteria bacterium]|nr:hypothetical protein [Candidatus Eisenbacteria bacterium]
MNSPWLRPATHAAVLGFVALEPALGRWGMAGVAAAATLVNLLLLPRTAFGRALARPGEGRWNGLVSYPFAVAACYAIFPSGVAALSWTAMAIGDPAASLVGGARRWKARIPWNSAKSIAGSLAFLAAAWAALSIALLLLGAADRGPLLDCVLLAGALAALGAFVESFAIPPDDNLPVALAIGAAIWFARGGV